MGLRSFIHQLTAPKSSGSVPKGSFKLVLVINHDLKMGKGKIAAQAGHASVSATLKMGVNKPNLLDAWLKSGQKKVCLKTTQDELLELEKHAVKLGIQTVRVNDAGKTQIPSGSLTVIAFGPGQDDELEQLTGHLKLL
ncbi:peptidyl-tRNA hydrolase Pth2 [Candidatus Poseidoniales archaeon]|nr:peptidyl-tRNA hydrolase Pth2 [Candidatus Poseidoniales archaeon]